MHVASLSHSVSHAARFPTFVLRATRPPEPQIAPANDDADLIIFDTPRAVSVVTAPGCDLGIPCPVLQIGHIPSAIPETVIRISELFDFREQ